MLSCCFYAKSFQEEADGDSEEAWKLEDKKVPEAFVPRGTKGTRRAYELALKAFQDLAREVLLTSNAIIRCARFGFDDRFSHSHLYYLFLHHLLRPTPNPNPTHGSCPARRQVLPSNRRHITLEAVEIRNQSEKKVFCTTAFRQQRTCGLGCSRLSFRSVPSTWGIITFMTDCGRCWCAPCPRRNTPLPFPPCAAVPFLSVHHHHPCYVQYSLICHRVAGMTYRPRPQQTSMLSRSVIGLPGSGHACPIRAGGRPACCRHR